jgi:hypothetical protein
MTLNSSPARSDRNSKNPSLLGKFLKSAGEVKAVLADRLAKLASDLEALRIPSAHETTALADIRRWQQNPAAAAPGPALQMPPGDPI